MKIHRELDELENTKYKLTFWISFGSKPMLRDHAGFQLAGVCTGSFTYYKTQTPVSTKSLKRRMEEGESCHLP